MLYRIFGRKKSGKSEFIYREIENCIHQSKPCFLIVPEQQTLTTERQIISRFGNKSNMYVEVISFSRLCNRIFREIGGLSQKYIGNAGRILVMSLAADSVRDALKEYKETSDNSDFLNKAISVIDELVTCNINPPVLEKAISKMQEDKGESTLTKKLSDISLIFSAYKSILHAGFDDKGDDLDRLYDLLTEYRFFEGKTIFIDSFYGFTPQETKILSRIICQAHDTYITFLCEKNKDERDEIFIRSGSAADSILKIASDFGITYKDSELFQSENNEDNPKFDISLKYYLSTEIYFVEKYFSTSKIASGISEESINQSFENSNQATGTVEIISCVNIFDEANAASSIIGRLIREKGARYRDIAVCARDISYYEGVIDTVFERDDIPFNFNRREDLLTKPIVAYVTSAFEVCSTWQQSAILRYIKTGLTKLTDEEADLFEIYIGTWNITGSRLKSGEWFMNPSGYVEEFTDRDNYVLEIVNKAREKLLLPLEAFYEDLKASENACDISKAVYKLICDSGFFDFEREEDEISQYNMVMDALDEMVAVLCESAILPKKYFDLFRLVISQYSGAKIPEAIDEVYVGSASLMRTENISYMLLLGANDGIFPAKSTEDNVFSDKERDILKSYGLSLSGNCADAVYDELFLAYNAVASARNGLYILHSKSDIAGTPLRESVIVSIINNILPNVKCGEYPFQSVFDNITTEGSLWDFLSSDASSDILYAAKKYFSEKQEYSDKLSEMLREKGGSERLSSVYMLYSDNMTMSPSRLEKYSKCAFSFFGEYILKIKPEAKGELGSLETGNIVHKILEIFTGELAEKKKSGSYPDDTEYAANRVNEILSGYMEKLIGVGVKGKISKRFTYLYNRLSKILTEMAQNLWEEFAQSDFLPVDFELNIGRGDNAVASTPIPVTDGDGTDFGKLYIVGKIDRVDSFIKDGKAYIRIVDYKTGEKVFSKNDVYSGLNLQMLLYLFSIWQNGKKRYGDEIVPAGVLYIPVKRPSVSVNLGSDEDKASDEFKKSFKPNGILIDDIEVLRGMDKEMSGKFIPAKLKNDGGFYSGSSVESLEKLGKLLYKATEASSKLALEIKSGNITINPYKCDKVNSCLFCKLLPVCRHERGDKNTRFELQKIVEEEE